MSQLSEATAASCFQCMGENVTVLGHDGMRLNDFYERLCRTMVDSLAATSNAGDRESHRRIMMANTERNPIESGTATANEVVEYMANADDTAKATVCAGYPRKFTFYGNDYGLCEVTCQKPQCGTILEDGDLPVVMGFGVVMMGSRQRYV